MTKLHLKKNELKSISGGKEVKIDSEGRKYIECHGGAKPAPGKTNLYRKYITDEQESSGDLNCPILK